MSASTGRAMAFCAPSGTHRATIHRYDNDALPTSHQVMHRNFRFGVSCGAVAGMKPGDFTDIARLIEDQGFDVMLVPDHYAPVLSPLPALMAAAQATTHL